MTDKQLGFIGVGRMGQHMASRLLEAGYALTIFDTNETAMQRLEQRGAKRAKSPADVASQCATVLVSLPTPDVVKAVALGKDGVIEGSKAKVFVDLSTTGPRVAKEVAEGLAKKGITAVDSPVSGGPTGAEKGTLAMMIACPRPLADELRPAIEVLGKFFYIGDQPGAGQTMKVINNLLSATAITPPLPVTRCHSPRSAAPSAAPGNAPNRRFRARSDLLFRRRITAPIIWFWAVSVIEPAYRHFPGQRRILRIASGRIG